MNRFVLALPFQLLLSTLPFAPSEVPVYAPADGTTLAKVFSHSTDLELAELRSSMGGQEVPAEFLPELEIIVHDERHVAVTDRILAAAEGRPLILERTFDELAAKASEEVRMVPGEDSKASGRATSPLEGRTVRFVWNEDEGTHEATFVDDEDEEVPEGLLEDMDARIFLPAEEVEEGAEWELEGNAVGALFAPAGDVAWEWERDEGMQADDEDGDGELEGTLTVRYAGVQSGDGLALLEISGDLTTFEEQEGDLEDIPVADGTATIRTDTLFEVTGKLWWNLAAGHFDSLEVTAEMTVESVTSKDPGQPGPEFESTVVLVGTWSAEASVTTP